MKIAKHAQKVKKTWSQTTCEVQVGISSLTKRNHTMLDLMNILQFEAFFLLWSIYEEAH